MVNPRFVLHPRLAQDCHNVGESVFQSGEIEVLLFDDARYAWLILVPRVPDMVEWMDLPKAAQLDLHSHMLACATALQTLYAPDKINMGALGNLVAQLHVHIIARYKNDAAWPAPVWGHSVAQKYSPAALDIRLGELRLALDMALGMGRA